MLATLAATLSRGRRVAVRAQMGRLSRDRHVSTAGSATLRSRNDNDLTARFAGVARALGRACDRPPPSSTARSAPSTRTGARDSGSCSRAPARSSSSRSTCSPSTAAAARAAPTERRERLEALLDPGVRRVLSRPPFDDGARCSSRRARARARRRRRQAPIRPTGRAALDGLAEGEAARAPGARDRGVHTRRRAAARAGSGRSSSPCGSRRASVSPGNVGTGFSDAELDRLQALLDPLATRRRRRSRRCRGCPGSGEVTSPGSSRARRRGRVRRVDARRPAACARLPWAA